MRKIAFCYLLISLLFGLETLSADEYKDYNKTYTTGLETVILEAMDNSRTLKATRKKHKATKLSLESERAYYYPKLSLGSDFKQHYGDATPDPERVGDVSIKVQSKIYGGATNDKIEAAYSTERAAYNDTRNKENEIYYIVLTALSKIERTRLYVHNAEILRKEMMTNLDLLKNEINEGISPASDLKKADLVIARFDDAVFAEESNIERLFYELQVATEVEISLQDEVGIPVSILRRLSDELESSFNVEVAIGNNFDIISKELNLKAVKHQALSQNEYVKLNLINETFVNYLNEETGLEPGGIKADSYVGMRLDITLFDHQKSKTDEAAYMRYLADRDTLDDEKEKIRSKVKLLQRNYQSLAFKKKNSKKQMELSRKLVESQKNDLWIDRVTHHDLIESLSSYNRSAITSLALDIQVYDTIFGYWELKAEAIF